MRTRQTRTRSQATLPSWQARKSNESRRLSEPEDAQEREADAAAQAVMEGRPLAGALSTQAGSGVQREGQVADPDSAAKYRLALTKLGEAFLATPLGKDLLAKIEQDPLVEGAKDFASSLPGLVVTGSAAAGAIAALAATHSELPFQLPAIPLDKLRPGLSMKLVYEGPVDAPSKAVISFSGTFDADFGAPKPSKKEKPDQREAYRAETARLARDQEAFRQGLKTPEQRQTEDAAFWKSYSQMQGGGSLLGIPGLKPASEAPEKPKKDDGPGVARKPVAGGAPKHQATAEAPRAVDEALSGIGQPLDAATRRFMEARFGHDFSQVRIHADRTAAHSARAVAARAYTVGADLVFAEGQFAPTTSEGRRLLAHELAHVVQQDGARASGGPDAPLMRDKDEEAERARRHEAEMDSFNAMLIRSLNNGVERFPPDILIPYAEKQASQHADALALGHTESRLALASLMVNLHTALVAQEESAERDVDGSLLLSDPWNVDDGLKPWTDKRPRSLSEIPPFTPENIAAWQTDAALDEKIQSAERAREASRPRDKAAPAASEPPPLMPETEVEKPEPETERWDFMAGGRHGVAEQAATPEEKAAQGLEGGSTEIRAGLAALSGQTLAGAGVTKTRTNQEDSPEVAKRKGETTLLAASAQIWFISNRLYVLDRTGHLLRSEDVWFDVSSVRGYKPGGTYFLAPIDVIAAQRTLHFEPFPVSGHGSAKVELASINFPRVLTALIPVEELRQSARANQAGIGLIVAKNFGKKRLSVSDLSFGKLSDAVGRAPGHLEWAVRAEAARILDDPAGEVVNQLIGVGGSYLARLLPPVGAALFMYQALKLAQWLGEVGNIAVYAQTDDEIDIAAQAIARKVASFVISEAITRGLRVTGKGLVKLKAKAKKAPAKTQAPSKPAKQEPANEEPVKAKEPVKEPAKDVVKEPAKTPAQAEQTPAVPPAKAPQHPSAKKATPDVEPAPKPRKPTAEESEAMRAGRERVPDQPETGQKPGDTTAPKSEAPGPDAAKPAAKTQAPAQAPAKTPAPPQPTTPKKHAIDDVLSSDRKDIAAGDSALHQRLTADQSESLMRLQAAYRKYKDKRARQKLEAKSPEDWLRHQTTGQPRKDAENLFGPDYARTGHGSKTPRPGMRIADVPRPQNYDEARLKTDLDSLRDQPGVWDRLKRLRQNGVTGGEVDPGLFQILKGNIGELLARPAMDTRLAEVKVQHPDARLEFGTRIARVKPDGGHESPVLFSDGLIVSGGKGKGPLQVHDAFEVKAGSRGGAEATTQFHDWREGRLSTGDKLVLADGQSFTVKPNAQGAGQVGGMQTATPHLVAARGAEAYGTGSGDQVAVPVTDKTRHALGQTASELEYLARRLLEGLPQNAAPAAGGSAAPGGTKP